MQNRRSMGAFGCLLVVLVLAAPAGVVAASPRPSDIAASPRPSDIAASPRPGDGPSTGGTSGRRSFPLPRGGGQVAGRSTTAAAATTVTTVTTATTAAGNPQHNIAPRPAFPDRCFQAYQSADCTKAALAALNNARHVMGLPSYRLPAGFARMTPAYQFLALSNADRILAGRRPVTAFNPTLNSIAQHAAAGSADPTGPDVINGVPTVDWSANWAGGMSPLEAYYDWMYYDGYGSNNLDCAAPTDAGCWGHRENTLHDFGRAEVAMGVGLVFSGASYGTSFSELYWAYRLTGPRLPRLPAVFAMATTRGPAAGGTRVVLAGYGLENASLVVFGRRSVKPLWRSATSLIVRTPPGTGVVPVQVTGNGGTSPAVAVATFSYLRPPGAGSFVPLLPARLLDTRIGLGTGRGKLSAQATLRLPVTGRGGVPVAGVAAVVLNVVAVGPAAKGYLTVFPSGSVRPRTSSLNYAAERTVANAVVVPVGRDGRVAIFDGSAGALDLLADVSGYYLAGAATAAGSFTAVAPSRLLDTRIGLGAPRARVSTSGTVRVVVTGRNGIPARGVASVFLNVTVVDPANQGYLTVFAGGGTRPTASNLDFRPHQTVPDLVLTAVGADGSVAVFNGSGGPVDVLADVVGYVRAGPAGTEGATVAVNPSRTFDSRSGVGVATFPPYDVAPQAGQIFVVGPGYRVPLLVTGRHGVPAVGVGAVVLTVTVLEPLAGGYYTVYPDGSARPRASNLDFVSGATVPNLVMVPVGANGLINLYNGSSSLTSLVVDVAGYVLAPGSP